jgi:Nucleotidyl transferase AbiEii toxin, Type IV TA system
MPTLPPETERLWRRLEHEPLLAGWYLIGGTALGLLIGHRQSEDLDFAWPVGGKLPVHVLSQLITNLDLNGWQLKRDDDPNAYDEFLIVGMSLHDYQQNFIATAGGDPVKLTFFSPDPPLAALLPKSTAPAVVIPPLPLLFQSKALAASARSTVRDWVDLYILMTQHGFTMDDFVSAYNLA